MLEQDLALLEIHMVLNDVHSGWKEQWYYLPSSTSATT